MSRTVGRWLPGRFFFFLILQTTRNAAVRHPVASMYVVLPEPAAKGHRQVFFNIKIISWYRPEPVFPLSSRVALYPLFFSSIFLSKSLCCGGVARREIVFTFPVLARGQDDVSGIFPVYIIYTWIHSSLYILRFFFFFYTSCFFILFYVVFFFYIYIHIHIHLCLSA